MGLNNCFGYGILILQRNENCCVFFLTKLITQHFVYKFKQLYLGQCLSIHIIVIGNDYPKCNCKSKIFFFLRKTNFGTLLDAILAGGCWEQFQDRSPAFCRLMLYGEWALRVTKSFQYIVNSWLSMALTALIRGWVNNSTDNLQNCLV